MRAIKKDDRCRPLNVYIISQNVQKINFIFLTARSSWIFNKKSVQMDGKSDLAGPLDDFRTLLLRDYDEIVRNINELSEWIENNK